MNQLGEITEKSGTGLAKTLVLVGLMGAGKTSVGRRLAARLETSFSDADDAIVDAAGISIPDIFEMYGEVEFRDLERRVIARLLTQPPHVLALGGGAFMDPETRATISELGTSLWLKADLDTLVARTAKRRAARPLLMNGEPSLILAELMKKRYPVYAAADHQIDTSDRSQDENVQRIVKLLSNVGVVGAHV